MSDALKQSWQKNVLWLFAVVGCICALLYFIPDVSKGDFPGFPGLLIIWLACAFAFIHGIKRYGIKNTLVAFVVFCLLGWFFENLGPLTGFPFGPYHYTMMPNARLFMAPIMTGPAYFGPGYLAWVVALAIMGGADSNPRSKYFLFGLPVVASFIMCMWDVCLDPTASTIKNAWVWHNGGGYFGVPLTNFLGWFLMNWLAWQLVALYFYRKNGPVATKGSFVESKSFYLPAIVLYFANSLQYVCLFFKNKIAHETALEIIDKGGQVWRLGNLYETTVVVFLFTVLPISIIAVMRVFQMESSSGAK